MALTIAADNTDCLGVITLSAQAFVEQRTLSGILEAQRMFQDPAIFAKLTKWHGDKATWILNSWVDCWTNPAFATWELTVIEQVTCPILAIHGEKDEYGSQAFPSYIVEKAPGRAEMELIADCGHLPHQSHEQLVLLKTEHFINAMRI
jgi:pimeloyl-ACP methyl ester carboxylesterase